MIELENYAIYHKNTALIYPISLKIPQGEFFAVIGESGGGKTLLTQAVLSLLPEKLSEYGTITRSTKSIEMVVQQPLDSLQRNISIRLQFHQFLKSRGVKEKQQRKEKIYALLKEVGFSDPNELLSKKAFELSGGICQRVAIAMALYSVPKLLVADEPTSALDETSRELILNLLSDVHRDYQMTLLLVTHDLSIVKRFSTYVAIMKEGRLIESGPTKQVLSQPKEDYTKELIHLFEERNANTKNRSVNENI